jgi:hypothetical protein
MPSTQESIADFPPDPLDSKERGGNAIQKQPEKHDNAPRDETLHEQMKRAKIRGRNTYFSCRHPLSQLT